LYEPFPERGCELPSKFFSEYRGVVGSNSGSSEADFEREMLKAAKTLNAA
jgi:hypothetical protein